MNDPCRAEQIGLERLLPLLEKLWRDPIDIDPERRVLGPAAYVGSSGPLPSSAARLRFGDHTVWLPAPEEPGGRAPLYCHAGQTFVMPIIRLFLTSREAAGEGAKPVEQVALEYLTLSHWLCDAFSRWLFPRKDGQRCTILERLHELRPSPRRDLHTVAQVVRALHTVAQVVRYALFGSAGYFRLMGLVFPPCPMWLRPVGSTPLAREAARALVITARLDLASASDRAAVPTTDIRAAEYRIQPGKVNQQGTCPDWGIDPVHTPEGADIRMTGRLGVGVQVTASRRLAVPQGDRLPLSASTSRLPFAGYNDPRRLLMAASMQLQAVPLSARHEPLVRQDANGIDPPGVNLRVAYLAWQGWNHEDAWVLSESAAAKLGTPREVVQTIAIRAVELAAELLVEQGQEVERGSLLVKRRVAPVLLTNSLETLARFAGLDDARAPFDSALLAKFARLDEHVQLEPEVGDRATEAGKVTRIETWDLLDPDGAPGPVVPEALPGAYRTVYRITIRRDLPLAIGDKLANRHGHKGVVGAILPDDAMPRWDGQPLEAILDPISVLNRSNWGQVYEVLAGAVALKHGALNVATLSGEEVLRRAAFLGVNERGQSEVHPAKVPGWLSKPVRAVAGVQYVMRLPHHALDKISASPLPPEHLVGNLRRRAQRFGEMDQWALGAHGLMAPLRGSARLSAAAERFRRLLATAGFALDREDGCLAVRSLALDTEPPADVVRLEPTEGRQSETFKALEDVDVAPATVLVFDPPVSAVRVLGEQSDRDEEPETIEVRWLPVLPACDRPELVRSDGSKEAHDLTRGLRQVIRAARDRSSAVAAGADALEESERLSHALHDLMRDAYAFAVGLRATGPLSSKLAFLRRGVLGRRVAYSGRATVTPAGTLGLDLDEVGLPTVLARALFGPHLADKDDALAAQVEGRRVWLKRDPVLSRWGLLAVRVRLTPGNTIRLPASLLGPLGADFDGDTVAVFARLPGAPSDPRASSPSALACDYTASAEGRAMFLPSKQYRYGLHKLVEDPERLKAFQHALRTASAPDWPLGGVSDCLEKWVRWAAKAKPEGGRWWAILEQHALKALADDPGMTFGLPRDARELAALPVVRCGAAKDLCVDDPTRQATERFLRGKSLEIYQSSSSASSPLAPDPIHEVMVVAKEAIGRFGGALRRLVYSATPLHSEGLCDAQCLTEQATQKALSVKAGKPPFAVSDYERQLQRLLEGQAWERAQASELQALLQSMDAVWERLRRLMSAEPVGWLEWLRKPHELAALLRRQPNHIIRLPLDDLRMWCWLDHTDAAAR
jgi:hypothetical protein